MNKNYQKTEWTNKKIKDEYWEKNPIGSKEIIISTTKDEKNFLKNKMINIFKKINFFKYIKFFYSLKKEPFFSYYMYSFLTFFLSGIILFNNFSCFVPISISLFLNFLYSDSVIDTERKKFRKILFLLPSNITNFLILLKLKILENFLLCTFLILPIYISIFFIEEIFCIYIYKNRKFSNLNKFIKNYINNLSIEDKKKLKIKYENWKNKKIQKNNKFITIDPYKKYIACLFRKFFLINDPNSKIIYIKNNNQKWIKLYQKSSLSKKYLDPENGRYIYILNKDTKVEESLKIEDYKFSCLKCEDFILTFISSIISLGKFNEFNLNIKNPSASKSIIDLSKKFRFTLSNSKEINEYNKNYMSQIYSQRNIFIYLFYGIISFVSLIKASWRTLGTNIEVSQETNHKIFNIFYESEKKLKQIKKNNIENKISIPTSNSIGKIFYP